MAASTIRTIGVVLSVVVPLVTGCGGGGSGSSDSVTIEGSVAVAYVRRTEATLGNPTDAVIFSPGGDLFMRERSSPSAPEINITGSYTQGRGDVSDPEVSYDGTRILFSMRGPSDATWDIWEYDVRTRALRRVNNDNADPANGGDDVDPAYLADGRIVFSSNRQQASRVALGYKYLDEYEREVVAALHVMNADGSNIRQISFNQSHDRNPTVLQTGEIMFARWDHVGGRNQFSIFKINPDGTDPFVLYGAHSPGNSYLHPREMPDRRVVSSLMPLSGTREGGSLEIIDVANYSENDDPVTRPGPTNAVGDSAGQYQASRVLFPTSSTADQNRMRGMGFSPMGRFSTPYPLWDGTQRMLVTFSPPQPQPGTNALGQAVTVEGLPRYGIYMLDLNQRTLLPVALPTVGFVLADPVAIQARTLPKVPSAVPLDEAQTGVGFGILNVKSVYDTDSRERMGNGVLTAAEAIPQLSGRPNLALIKQPGSNSYTSRVARFFRITKAVPTPPGLDRETIGETEFEMQQILGYGVVEPDGSITARIPADTALNIAVLDRDGRAFTPHTNWIQARSGETRTCNGCHSPRRGDALNAPGIAGNHPQAGSVGESMSETRVNRINASARDLARDINYSDIWTGLYNLRDGTSHAAEGAITVSYADLNPAGHAHTATIPTPVKGPAGSCTGASWSAANCAIVINYEQHIQPVWDNHCVACHTGANPPGALDLSRSVSGVLNRFNSYQELLVGDPVLVNGLPVITMNEDGELMIQRGPPLVESGSSRASRLIERLYEQKLKGPAGVVFGGAGATQNHANLLNAAEKRLVAEWIDVGAQYYNDPFDSGGQVRRSNNNLSQAQFAGTVHPILMSNCAGCHQAFGGNGTSSGAANGGFAANRFVLTGNIDADFNVTATMVNDVCTPANSYLLRRPSGTLASNPPHPDAPAAAGTAVLPAGSANYEALRTWIAAARTSSCPP